MTIDFAFMRQVCAARDDNDKTEHTFAMVMWAKADELIRLAEIGAQAEKNLGDWK